MSHTVTTATDPIVTN